MRIEEQTDAVKLSLYELTQKYVAMFWRRFYCQYRGDCRDLAGEIFLGFMQPRGRVKGQERTLLDYYEPDMQPWDIFVRYAVVRRLIDKSRGDRVSLSSYEFLVDEYGDRFAGDEVVRDGERVTHLGDLVMDLEDMDVYRRRWSELSLRQKGAVIAAYNKVYADLSEVEREAIEEVTGCVRHMTMQVLGGMELTVLAVTEQSVKLRGEGGTVLSFDKRTGFERQGGRLRILGNSLREGLRRLRGRTFHYVADEPVEESLGAVEGVSVVGEGGYVLE